MRYRITIATQGELSLPIDNQEYLTATVYGLLERSDAAYARALHDEGYPVGDGSGRRIKPFTYSRLQARLRRIDKQHDRIVFPQGRADWFISSPVEEFMRHLAVGLLANPVLQIGGARVTVEQIQSLAAPEFREEMKFTCLSPIVASIPTAERGTLFLRPLAEPDQFSETIRKNLVSKYRALHNAAEPPDPRFAMVFDPAYLARSREGGCHLTTFKGIQTVGAFAPFTATGSVEMIELGYTAGFGSKTAQGHGMVEAVG